MAEAHTPVEIFCSYAHEDEVVLRKLETHLSLLKRQGLISLWYDRLILPGADWTKSLDTHLETASVILLLVSANFFASNYCVGIEMKRALERQEAGEVQVIPILVRSVNWKEAPFAHLQALPTDAKPIMSWRDKDRALADVAAGIRRVIVEELPQLTASVPRMALPAIWNIPYPRNPFFLGRESELLRIRQNLHTGQATALSQPQAINGLGGIGKTQLALEYAYRYHQDYTAVLWARAESTETLVSSYVAIATLLRLPECEAKEQDITVQEVKTWLQTHRGWLLILDNADELALLPNFLPPSLGGHLLLTTRAAVTGRLARRLEIETLQPEHGALFLLRRAGLIAPDVPLEQASSQQRELALQISQELGELPLALDQVGAYLEEAQCSLFDYLSLYQIHRADLLKERGGYVQDHPEPVATTLLLSFTKVELANPAAADLLRVCSFLQPDAIPEEIIIGGAHALGPHLEVIRDDPLLFNRAIKTLLSYSLIQRIPDTHLLSMHRLVQAMLKDTMGATMYRTWATRTVQALYWIGSTCVLTEPERRENWMEEPERREYWLAHTLGCVPLIDELQLFCGISLLAEASEYLFDDGHGLHNHREAEPLLVRCVQMCERQLGLEHPKTARHLLSLSLVYYFENEWDKAEPLLLRCLWMSKRANEQLFGEEYRYDNPETLLYYLIDLYTAQDKYAEAELLYQRVLGTWEVNPEVNPELCATSSWLDVWLNKLADLYKKQGKHTEAEPMSLLQQAVYIREQHFGPEHLQVSYSLTNLANFYREQGEYLEAEPLYRRALRIFEQYLGPEYPETAETMYELARLREAQGNNDEAIVWYSRALTRYERIFIFGVDHPKTTEIRTHLIALLHTLGQHEEAAQLEAIQSEP